MFDIRKLPSELAEIQALRAVVCKAREMRRVEFNCSFSFDDDNADDETQHKAFWID